MATIEPTETENNRIRSTAEELGGSLPIRDIARHCMEAGIWDEMQLESMMLNGCSKRVKDALGKDIDGSGLPGWAAVGKGRDAIWKQREMFEFKDYAVVIGLGIEAMGADHMRLKTWQVECHARFGTAPSIPDLVH